jgi:hypothetical protein
LSRNLLYAESFMADDRAAIDPDGRYPADGFREVEQNALRLMEWMPGFELERTRDVIQLSLGDEDGIVVLVTREAFEFRLPTVEWTASAYGPAAASRLWRRVPTSRASDRRLKSLVQGAMAARKSEFRDCRFCGRSTPPEHRHGDDVCHSCAEEHLGVVY